MPLTVTVSFDPSRNIARFELDTSSMSTTQNMSSVLMSTFEHATDEDWDNLSALEEGTITGLDIPINLSSWRHQSHKIQRSLELAHFWDIPQEDCAVLWKTEDSSCYNEVNDIPGPEDTVHKVGTATINDFIRVGDPCYKWNEFKDTHLEVLPGAWTFELTSRDDNTHGMGNGHRPARLVAYNHDAGPIDVEALIAKGLKQ